MADETSSSPPIPQLAEISTALAPVIYFDAAPTFGFNNGICSVSLEAFTFVNAGGVLRAERRVVAHLRMTPTGYESLKGALDGIVLSAVIPPSETVN